MQRLLRRGVLFIVLIREDSKVKLSPHLFKDSKCWSGRGLNLQPPAQQTGAYPIELTEPKRVFDQYFSIGEPLRVWNPDPVKDKKIPKIHTLFRTKPSNLLSGLRQRTCTLFDMYTLFRTERMKTIPCSSAGLWDTSTHGHLHSRGTKFGRGKTPT